MRFLQNDPIGFMAGDANTYRYESNCVTSRTDPSGLFDPSVVGEPFWWFFAMLDPNGFLEWFNKGIDSCSEAFDSMWQDSKPNAATSFEKREQGGWIVWDKKQGRFRVIRWPAGEPGIGFMKAGPRPNDPNLVIMASIHTHPFTKEEGYDSEKVSWGTT
jgi:hypothetical protein